MTTEERKWRIAAIRGTMERIGATPDGAYEPPLSAIFLIAIENRFKGMKGGVVMEVGKRAAAVLIVDGSHREATEDEIEAYHRDQAERKAVARDAELRKQRRTVVFTKPPVSELPASVEESPAE